MGVRLRDLRGGLRPRLRLRLQDAGLADRPGEDVGLQHGSQRPHRSRTRDPDRRRVHGLAQPRRPQRGQCGVGASRRDADAQRGGGGRAMGDPARRAHHPASGRHPGDRRPGGRGGRSLGGHGCLSRARGTFLEGRHPGRTGAVLLRVAGGERRGVPRGGRARQPAVPHPATGVGIRRGLPRYRLRAAHGGRLRHRARVAPVGHAARLGGGAPPADRPATLGVPADRRAARGAGGPDRAPGRDPRPERRRPGRPRYGRPPYRVARRPDRAGGQAAPARGPRLGGGDRRGGPHHGLHRQVRGRRARRGRRASSR